MTVNWKKERIEIPIYFTHNGKRLIMIDYESIQDELNDNLKQIEKEKRKHLP